MRKVKNISEEFVIRSVIKFLSKNGWGHFQFGGLRDKGVDLKARHVKYSRYFLIEAKGEGSPKSKSQRSQRETHFVYGLGQLMTRMNVKEAGYYYGLALPDISAKIATRRLPWQVAKKLSLFVFSVDNSGDVKKYSWQDLKKNQKK